MKKAIYAGSFDPLHSGHKAVIIKALKLVEHLIIVVSNNPDKNNLSNLHQRYEEIKAMYANNTKITVIKNENELIGNIAKQHNVNFLIRSARNNIDYELELDIAAGNHQVNPDLETILIIPDYEMIGISSTLIRHKKALDKNNV
ncbi:phosphopantetheine adenylyltransferase [Mycoplasmopsis californica HAZ160_1]|uniref:Pantetheine-phosphate adenylyltransferase n=2 Tax=Mycoplasmopsis californica TaxID=2113 RepID=A0A059XQY8_9BACT|nr:pantetheine-phosphate adenylyltransferase [Mycoplasmopsis californica]AIA29465.1 phosphopantetheine adenylyltransferase [Mycoplasmopsis californica]BAP01087.1 phosphopantetheine adenylyltransferase [Mycoplasmopsis californica HAZ160_1]BBG40952.1 phosphopantetheine adenylyltransferase [Mycoplasmopsis californica]BBG41546.1 phosphopantetheine adenylyltransferase [Mycoplasmopsis californica]BBG42139.1 phosphopantetheine adenylyltransferase [Mycoplasmopsis californica]